jgi:DNA-binding GntR family transcriptional regulator
MAAAIRIQRTGRRCAGKVGMRGRVALFNNLVNRCASPGCATGQVGRRRTGVRDPGTLRLGIRSETKVSSAVTSHPRPFRSRAAAPAAAKLFYNMQVMELADAPARQADALIQTPPAVDLGTGALAADRVVAALRLDIVEGRLRPGARLVDQRLADRFGVSRNTIRDALRILTVEGLVVARVNAGSAVRRLQPADVRDIYLVRRVLELAAVDASALAAQEHLGRIASAVERAERAVRDGRWNEVGTASLAFHSAVVDLHGSPRLRATFETVTAQLRLAFAEMEDEAEFQSQWIPRDRAICELILSGRRAEAGAELDRYLGDSEQLVLDAVRRVAWHPHRRRPAVDRTTTQPRREQR